MPTSSSKGDNVDFGRSILERDSDLEDENGDDSTLNEDYDGEGFTEDGSYDMDDENGSHHDSIAGDETKVHNADMSGNSMDVDDDEGVSKENKVWFNLSPDIQS